jgi:hypothetical protein
MQSVQKTCAWLFKSLLMDIKQDEWHKVVPIARNVAKNANGG